MRKSAEAIISHANLISFWDFQEDAGRDRVAKGPHAYCLSEQAGPVERVEDGIFGPYAARIARGQWFKLPRRDCPALDLHGKNAQVTIIAWLKRENLESQGCEAVAGIWNETERKRQYCLFLNLRIWDSAEQVCGHVSSVGGPTPGYLYCMTSAIGSTPVDKERWHAVAFTYDGTYAKVYMDGRLDERETYNPFFYDEGLFDGGADGADFTVAAVNRSGEMGNFYSGLLGGLAVFNRALTDEEIATLM